jgi:hypothetical protein
MIVRISVLWLTSPSASAGNAISRNVDAENNTAQQDSVFDVAPHKVSFIRQDNITSNSAG